MKQFSAAILIFITSVGFSQHQSAALLNKTDSISAKTEEALLTIQNSFQQSTDSLTTLYKQRLSKSDSLLILYKAASDSLQKRGEPLTTARFKVDSVARKRVLEVKAYKEKYDSIRKSTQSKIDTLPLPPEVKAKAANIMAYTDALTIPAIDKFIAPFPPVPDLTLQNQSLQEVGEKVEGIQALTSNAELEQLKKAESLKNVSGEMVEEKVETEVARLDEVKAITGNNKEAEGMLAAKNAEAVKKQYIDQAKKAAFEYFDGQGEMVKQSMELVASYKKKYESVADIKEIKNKFYNSLSGKPFRERFVPGIQFQFQRKGNYMLDSYAYGAYRISKKFMTGIGWNQRLAWDNDFHHWDNSQRVYGPRAFVQFNFVKGFALHTEVEYLNTNTRLSPNQTVDSEHREWVFSSLTGIKTTYAITKHIKGTMLVHYNFVDFRNKSPYVDKLAFRTGVEILLGNK